jgi:Fe2+ transport system protein FeoA
MKSIIFFIFDRLADVPPARARSGSVPLSQIAIGTTAVIDRIDAPAPVARRLGDLGFIPGTPVTPIRRAPLGDPGVYEIRGVQYCLRRSEAGSIRVRSDE